MNLREFYSKAFLTALPLAADAYFKHSDTLDLEFLR
jgi:hypothetical protein